MAVKLNPINDFPPAAKQLIVDFWANNPHYVKSRWPKTFRLMSHDELMEIFDRAVEDVKYQVKQLKN